MPVNAEHTALACFRSETSNAGLFRIRVNVDARCPPSLMYRLRLPFSSLIISARTLGLAILLDRKALTASFRVFPARSR